MGTRWYHLGTLILYTYERSHPRPTRTDHHDSSNASTVLYTTNSLNMKKDTKETLLDILICLGIIITVYVLLILIG